MRTICMMLATMFPVVVLAQKELPDNPVPKIERQESSSSKMSEWKEPKPVVEHHVADKKFWALTGANVGTSIARTISISRCRADHGIGPCIDGGYGPFGARETIVQIGTGLSVFLSYKVKQIEDAHHDKYKFWWTLQVATMALNNGAMIQNATKSFPPKQD